jgi:hypothetical protein
MAFDSRHKVVVPSPISDVCSKFSSPEGMARFVRLSSMCHSFEILSTDQIVLHKITELAGRSLDDLAVGRPTYDVIEPTQSSTSGEACTRIHFKLVERVPLLFGLFKTDVVIFGTQIVSHLLNLHIYESDANQGLVKIYKLRRFVEVEEQATNIEELIVGETKWLLRRYTQASCRKGHQEHMQCYRSCF